jgi:hypothetical protein
MAASPDAIERHRCRRRLRSGMMNFAMPREIKERMLNAATIG